MPKSLEIAESGDFMLQSVEAAPLFRGEFFHNRSILRRIIPWIVVRLACMALGDPFSFGLKARGRSQALARPSLYRGGGENIS